MEIQQPRRKKYSVVNKDSELPSPFRGGGSRLAPYNGPQTQSGATPDQQPLIDNATSRPHYLNRQPQQGNIHHKVGSHGEWLGSTVNEDGAGSYKEEVDRLVQEIDQVVSQDPGGATTPVGQPESRAQKSSVYSMYQDADDKLEMRLLLLGESQRGQLMRQLVSSFQQKVLLCLEHFKPHLTLTCLRVITSLSALRHNNPTATPRHRNSLKETETLTFGDQNNNKDKENKDIKPVPENRPKRPVKRWNSLGTTRNKSTGGNTPRVPANRNNIGNTPRAQPNSRNTKMTSEPKKPKDKEENLKSENSQQDSDKWAEPCNPFSNLDVEEALHRDLPIFTISRLRNMVQQILRRATLKQDGTLYFSSDSRTAVATRSVQYYIWFFEFMDYLHELHVSFTEKIFAPLFKYFNEANFLNAHGRTHTVSSAFSKLSHFSPSSDAHSAYESDLDADEIDHSVEQAKERHQHRASLLQLSKEYKEIKSIYDTTETDKIAQRLSFVKEQLDYLFDEEDEIDPEVYSEESGRMVEHLDMDFGTENLIRLVPDILVKLKKAAWLCARWLDLDEQRTKDVKDKLEQLIAIEEKLNDRLNVLTHEIVRGEKKLERETNELGRLMEREGRSDKIAFKTYNIDTHIENLEAKLKNLYREKDTFSYKLAEVVKTKNMREFQRLKFRFESNKLQRFLTERKLDTLKYQKNLLNDDLSVEMYVRPSVIHSTNRLQDECERLEQQLRQQREEAGNIRHALMPVLEDKESLLQRLRREEEEAQNPHWLTDPHNTRLNHLLLYPGQALYIRSFPGTINGHGDGDSDDDYRVNGNYISQPNTHRSTASSNNGLTIKPFPNAFDTHRPTPRVRQRDVPYPISTKPMVPAHVIQNGHSMLTRPTQIHVGNNRSLRAVTPPAW